MLAQYDLQLLRTYAHTVRVQKCPLVTQNQSVFTTSTGEKLTASHVNKIVTEVLGGSASQIRKALAGVPFYFSIFFYIYTYIYILYN